jgi:hypothetical protein
MIGESVLRTLRVRLVIKQVDSFGSASRKYCCIEYVFCSLLIENQLAVGAHVLVSQPRCAHLSVSARIATHPLLENTTEVRGVGEAARFSDGLQVAVRVDKHRTRLLQAVLDQLLDGADFEEECVEHREAVGTHCGHACQGFEVPGLEKMIQHR